MEDDKTEQKSGVIGVRLSREEFERFRVLVDRARKRNTLSDRAAVLRELIGFPAVPRTITDEDRQFLITGTEQIVEVVPPGRLTRRQEALIQKVKEIFLKDPESDLATAVSTSINALWIAFNTRGTHSPLQKKKKNKTKTKAKSDVTWIGSSPKEEQPPPG